MESHLATDEHRTSKPRRAEDSPLRALRRWWMLLGFAFSLGGVICGALATQITAPAQIIALRARVDTVRSDVREMQHDLDAHVRGMAAGRDTVVALVSEMRDQLRLTVIGLCLAGQLDRSMKRQLHCDRDP